MYFELTMTMKDGSNMGREGYCYGYVRLRNHYAFLLGNRARMRKEIATSM